MMELQLSKPITAHGETLHVLEMREPTYEEVEKFGIPFGYGPGGEMKIDTRSALQYLPVLAGVPRSSAAQMSLKDVFIASMKIVSFFTASESLEGSESDSTTPLTSGG